MPCSLPLYWIMSGALVGFLGLSQRARMENVSLVYLVMRQSLGEGEAGCLEEKTSRRLATIAEAT